jgi:hypothetical protein
VGEREEAGEGEVVNCHEPVWRHVCFILACFALLRGSGRTGTGMGVCGPAHRYPSNWQHGCCVTVIHSLVSQCVSFVSLVCSVIFFSFWLVYSVTFTSFFSFTSFRNAVRTRSKAPTLLHSTFYPQTTKARQLKISRLPLRLVLLPPPVCAILQPFAQHELYNTAVISRRWRLLH